MRTVLDTNILARGARSGQGLAAEILRLLATPAHVLILSPFLLSELSRVLRYPRMRAVHGLDDVGIDAYVHQIQTGAMLVNPPPPAGIVPPDPADDRVVATASAGQANALCSLDRHLRHPDVQKYCTQHGIRIVTDVELVQELRALQSAPPP